MRFSKFQHELYWNKINRFQQTPFNSNLFPQLNVFRKARKYVTYAINNNSMRPSSIKSVEKQREKTGPLHFERTETEEMNREELSTWTTCGFIVFCNVTLCDKSCDIYKGMLTKKKTYRTKAVRQVIYLKLWFPTWRLRNVWWLKPHQSKKSDCEHVLRRIDGNAIVQQRKQKGFRRMLKKGSRRVLLRSYEVNKQERANKTW